MDWRAIASVTTLVAGVAGVGTWLAFALTSSPPAPMASTAPAAPSLIVQRPSKIAGIEAPKPSARLASPEPASPVLVDPSMDPRPQSSHPPTLHEPAAPRVSHGEPQQPARPHDASAARERKSARPAPQAIDTEPNRKRPAVLTRPREPVVANLAPSRPPAPEMPAQAVAPPKPDPRYAGVLTASEITRIRSRLRLSGEQLGYWRPIEGILRELGRKQIAQVNGGQKPDFELTSDQSSRLYSAASPLLMSLREDQKAEARKLARSLGLNSVASMI